MIGNKKKKKKKGKRKQSCLGVIVQGFVFLCVWECVCFYLMAGKGLFTCSLLKGEYILTHGFFYSFVRTVHQSCTNSNI